MAARVRLWAHDALTQRAKVAPFAGGAQPACDEVMSEKWAQAIFPIKNSCGSK
jgi:hypothetical protein